MARKAKKEGARAQKTAKPAQPRPDGPKTNPARQAPDLDALCKPALAAGAKLEATEAEARAMVQKAEALMAQAKQAYREALAPYREACRKAGVECVQRQLEFPGGGD